MKLVTKNGVCYQDINFNIINDIINSVKEPFAIIDRDLTYNYSEDDGISELHYVDDITQDEIDKGTNYIKNYLFNLGMDDLFNKYVNFLSEYNK